MPHQRLSRQCARLIKPTRNNVPTEYNVQYKRWKNSGNVQHKEANASDAPVRRGKPSKPGRLQLSNDPTRSHAPYHPQPWTTEVDKRKVYRRPPDAYIDYAAIDNNGGYPNGDSRHLQSNHLTHRPKSSKSAAGKSYDASPQAKDKCLFKSNDRKHHPRRPPVMPKTAWVGNDETGNMSAVYRPNSTRSTNGQKTAESVVAASSLIRYTPSIMSKPHENCVTKRGSAERESKTEKRWRLSFPKDETQITKTKSSLTAFQKSRQARGESIEERNLKKIYANASDGEIKRILAAIRTISRDAESKKQNAKNSSSNASQTTVSKENLDKIRHAAYRGCIKAPSFCKKDVWSTTYNKSYCRNWKAEDYINPFNTDFEDEKETKSSESDVEVKNHYVSPDFVSNDKVACKNSEISLAENDNQVSDTESSCGSSVGRSCTSTPEADRTSSSTECTRKVEESRSERILREGSEIEEREFNELLKEDGRPKMTGHTTYRLAHNGAQGPRYEDPMWADIVALGSGHWNQYHNWEGAEKHEKGKMPLDVKAKKNDNNRYKISVYDQGEPAPTVNPLTKEMVLGKYGGGGIPRKNHISYVTEYMGRFTEMPLHPYKSPKRRA